MAASTTTGHTSTEEVVTDLALLTRSARIALGIFWLAIALFAAYLGAQLRREQLAESRAALESRVALASSEIRSLADRADFALLAAAYATAPAMPSDPLNPLNPLNPASTPMVTATLALAAASISPGTATAIVDPAGHVTISYPQLPHDVLASLASASLCRPNQGSPARGPRSAPVPPGLGHAFSSGSALVFSRPILGPAAVRLGCVLALVPPQDVSSALLPKPPSEQAQLALLDSNGRLLSGFGPLSSWAALPPAPVDSFFGPGLLGHYLTRPIGALSLAARAEPPPLFGNWSRGMAAIAACGALLGLAGWAGMRVLLRSARARAQSEILAIQHGQELEAEVEARTQELSDTLDSLRVAQREMLQAARLSSLGSLVSGVSHELNTPLGNMLVSLSALVDRIDDLSAKVSTGSASRNDLERHLSTSRELARLAREEASRCGALVVSFKQISVDQASERSRHFDLAELASNVVASFTPSLRGHSVDIAISVDARPSLAYGKPGFAAAALTLLLQNCAAHAFGSRAHGKIAIEASLVGRDAVLAVRDDGLGIRESDLGRIFDPFFTTAHGKGHRGIGLAVGLQLARALGGTLSCSASAPGQGASFILRFPAQADPLSVASRGGT